MTAIALTRNTEQTQVMSSREIAELTGKSHDNVRRDIQSMASGLSLTFEEKVEASTGGRPSKVFLLPKRESMILVSGYNIQMRAKIIDRWQELEQANKPVPALDLNDAAALRGVLLNYTEKVQELEATVAEQAPKVDGFDRIADHNGALTIRAAAKVAQMREKDFKQMLFDRGWVYLQGKKLHGYSPLIAKGFIIHKLFEYRPNKTDHQVLITAKGMTELAAKHIKEFMDSMP